MSIYRIYNFNQKTFFEFSCSISTWWLTSQKHLQIKITLHASGSTRSLRSTQAHLLDLRWAIVTNKLVSPETESRVAIRISNSTLHYIQLAAKTLGNPKKALPPQRPIFLCPTRWYLYAGFLVSSPLRGRYLTHSRGLHILLSHLKQLP